MSRLSDADLASPLHPPSLQAISYFVKDQTKSSTFIPQIAVPTTLSAAELTMNAGEPPPPISLLSRSLIHFLPPA